MGNFHFNQSNISDFLELFTPLLIRYQKVELTADDWLVLSELHNSAGLLTPTFLL